MHREYHKWYSPRLQREMEMLIHGHAGARVLIFPTSMGRYYEYEDRGMVENLHDQIEAGWLQLYCIDSVDGETFYNWHAHPGWRIWRYVQYEEYILNEVLPLSRARNANPFMMTHGCSFGAFHAVNIALRHPHLFGRVLALSGRYDMSNFFGGYSDTSIYLNTPTQYVPNLPEGPQLDAIRNLDIILVAGRDDPNIDNSRALSSALWNRNVWHAFREWDGWSHDWPYWKKMVRHYIGGHD
jgi:esterase/lipase superfamily enzyme